MTNGTRIDRLMNEGEVAICRSCLYTKEEILNMIKKTLERKRIDVDKVRYEDAKCEYVLVMTKDNMKRTIKVEDNGKEVRLTKVIA